MSTRIGYDVEYTPKGDLAVYWTDSDGNDFMVLFENELGSILYSMNSSRTRGWANRLPYVPGDPLPKEMLRDIEERGVKVLRQVDAKGTPRRKRPAKPRSPRTARKR